MRDVRRSESHEPIVDRLTNPAYSDVHRPVFSTIMDLLIFCAGVGLALDRRVPVSSSGKVVPYRVFENNQKEGFIFLVALSATKEESILSSERDEEAVQIFEEFAAGGLEELAAWLNLNAMDTSGVQTLLSRIQELLPEADAEVPEDLSPV